MTRDDLIFFKDWFTNFVKSYYSPNIEDRRNINLKEEHTLNVCKNILEIVRELNLNEDDVMLAETIALFHDIGRFPQYDKYRTFRDGISVNHGYLGAQTLIEKKILNSLPDDEQKLIIKAVRFHNAFSIPKKERQDIVFFIKLIRDADKLDIWRVFVDYYDSREEERATAAGLGLPDTSVYSKDVLSYIFKKEVASQYKLKTLNDFKLMQLTWVYDLNFKTSYKLLSERGYIDRIISYLPQDKEIKKVSLVLKECVRERLKEGS
jgi:putative nucleotidyltransferase with HDIG domain